MALLAKLIASLMLALHMLTGGGDVDLMSVLRQAGFRGDGLKMAYAIAMAESGGNARAHNPNVNTGDNSYGLFQINMLGGMGPERRRRYGLSSNSDLFDPLTNAKVAFKMSNGGKSWGPWSTYGNGAYRKYYGGSNAKISGSSGGGAGGAAETRRSAEELAEDYGFVDALFDSNKELKRLFDKAVKGQWTASKFQAELRDSRWWKTHSKSERDYLTKRFGDPATAKQDMRQAYVRVRQLANQMGLRETPGNLKKLNTWAYNAVAKGWNDSQLRNEIGKFVYFNDDKWQGEGGETQEKLREYAYSMGVTMSSKWYADKTRNVIRGMATIQDYESEIRKQAKATYGQWAKQIDGGQTVMDLASPYMQSMATILELPAGSINLQNTTIKRALQGKDKNTGANMVVPLWQFENELRNDPRWKKTKNAQDSMMEVAHQVLTDFGVKY